MLLLERLRDLGLDRPAPPEGRPGDPGLFGPGSEVWRVGRERILLAGGPAALLMQIAHPLVAGAVFEHSGFRRDPFERLRATLDAVLAISFGDRAQADAAARSVAGTHRKVRGSLAERVGPYEAGMAYRADDPDLAMWVHATLVSTAFGAYSALVGPLTPAQRDRYYQEAKRFARLFGVSEAVTPADYPAFEAYLTSMVEGHTLAVGEAGRKLAEGVLNPPVPTALKPAVAATRVVSAGLLPEALRLRFELPWGVRERALLQGISLSTKVAIRAVPPAVRYWPHYRTAVRRTRYLQEDRISREP